MGRKFRENEFYESISFPEFLYFFQKPFGAHKGFLIAYTKRIP